MDHDSVAKENSSIKLDNPGSKSENRDKVENVENINLPGNEANSKSSANDAAQKPSKIRNESLSPDKFANVNNEATADKTVDKIDVKGLDGLFILEALGASGLRSIRYCQEILSGVGVDKIICNDLEAHAVENMKANIAFNGETPKKIIETANNDANLLMMKHRLTDRTLNIHTRVKDFFTDDYKRDYDSSPFDVIDLDPYGSASPFLDAAVQSVRDGGLLCVTCTDLASMCGKSLEKCYTRYGAMSIKAKYGHELAIRIILGHVDRVANKHGRFITPLLSVRMDFYARVFIRVYSDKKEVHRAATRQGLVLQSSGCDSFYIQPFATEAKGVHKPGMVDDSIPQVCEETGKPMRIAGPVWIGEIHNPQFLQTLIKMCETPKGKPNPYLTHMGEKEGATVVAGEKATFIAANLQSFELIRGVVYSAYEEARGSPLFYDISSLAKSIRVSTPSALKLQSALVNAGYTASQSHCEPAALKTNAPPNFIWDVMRTWAREDKPSRFENDVYVEKDEESTEALILAKPIENNVNMSTNQDVFGKFKARKSTLGRFGKKKHDRVARWKRNPEKNWGPKARAEGSAKYQTHKKRKRKDNFAKETKSAKKQI
eukprot:augustus_masked-scaffold_9-processed-gene-2.9-mRNA-1 protein AED:0.10 eAED:0.16 QI:0/-1/0/1/-1/1/1/0/602